VVVVEKTNRVFRVTIKIKKKNISTNKFQSTTRQIPTATTAGTNSLNNDSNHSIIVTTRKKQQINRHSDDDDDD